MENAETVIKSEKNRSKSKRGRYCCVINCSNNTYTVDPRTGKQVKLHNFPNPITDKERCQRWLLNIRRKHLTLLDIQTKKVCSVHFEISAYSCPSDISSSRLLPNAIPTIIHCPNPPKSMAFKRKLLYRHNIVPQKKAIQHIVDDDVKPELDAMDTSNDSHSSLSVKLEKLQDELDKLKEEKEQALEELKYVKHKYRLLYNLYCEKK